MVDENICNYFFDLKKSPKVIINTLEMYLTLVCT